MTPRATVRLWDIAAGTEKPENCGNDSKIVDSSVSFSPDGKTLVTGYNDHGVRLWDVTTRTPIITTRGEFRNHIDLIFSPGWQDAGNVQCSAGDRMFWLNVPASGVAPEGTRLATDVNGDGAVNIQDLVAVSAAIGADREERRRCQRRWRGEHSRYGCRCRGAP